MTEAATATKTKDQEAFEAVKVGDIFVESWGYDQTNIDYYEVVAKTKARIKVRRIGKKVVAGSGGPSEQVVPAPGVFVESAIESKRGILTKRVYNSGWSEAMGIRPAFSCSSYSSAYAWDGKPESQTGAHYGH